MQGWKYHVPFLASTQQVALALLLPSNALVEPRRPLPLQQRRAAGLAGMLCTAEEGSPQWRC